MRQFDTIRHLMYQSAAKKKLLTAEQEKELSRKLLQAKLEMWVALLSDRLTVAAALAFCTTAALAQSKRKHEFTSDTFAGLVTASKRFQRRRIKANEVALCRARLKTAAELSSFDPCMEIGLALFHQVKAWQAEQHPGRSTTYTKYLQEIEACWKRYVFYRNQFIEKNIRLVIVMAKRFSGFGIPQEDLIQEATFGLQKAVGMFDPERGFKFSTYAGWWVRASVLRYCRDRSRIVRLPVNTQERLERYYAAVKKLEAEGKVSDSNTIAQMTGLEPEAIDRLRTLTLEHHYSMELETREGQNLGDTLADPDDFSEQLNMDFDLKLIEEVVADLPERDQFIVRARYGLDGGDGKTLSAIAEVYGLSRERVRQLESKALHSLRVRLQRRMDRLAIRQALKS